jgi:hypothetical protein
MKRLKPDSMGTGIRLLRKGLTMSEEAGKQRKIRVGKDQRY